MGTIRERAQEALERSKRAPVDPEAFYAAARRGLPDFAAYIERSTGPEMRERIRERISETRDCDAEDCRDCYEMADAVMSALTEGKP